MLGAEIFEPRLRLAADRQHATAALRKRIAALESRS